MDPRLNLITQRFNLRKLDKICNDTECEKPPSKRVLISEIDNVTEKKRELVILNLCTKHFENVRKFLRELGELTPKDRAIGIEAMDTGYVTY